MDSKIIHKFIISLVIFFTTQVNAIEFQGKFIQGHFILGKTEPEAKIKVNKKEVKVSNDGFFVLGEYVGKIKRLQRLKYYKR